MSDLPEEVRHTTAVTVRWYLSFCRRSRVAVCHRSAREFMAEVERQRQPEAWQVAGWKEAMRRLLRVGHYAYRTEQS